MDQRLDGLIRGMIQAERMHRTPRVSRELAQVTEDFTKMGGLGQGRYPVTLDGVAANEYEARVESWLAIVRRVVDEVALPWTPPLSQDVRHLIDTELCTDWDELLALLDKRAANERPRRIDQIDRAKDWARAHLTHELELLVFAQDRTRIPIADQLLSPRYAPVLIAWKKARSLLDAAPPDLANATKEAVAAVEQLARILTGQPTATLGEAIKALRASSRIQAPLLKGIEEVWGWASDTPGVRHGSTGASMIDGPTAAYVLTQTEGVIALLLSRDTN